MVCHGWFFIGHDEAPCLILTNDRNHLSMTWRYLVLIACFYKAFAYDVPTGIVALSWHDDDKSPCGASAVILERDATGFIAVTLEEALPVPEQKICATFPGGYRRTVTILSRGKKTTAVLLHIEDVAGINPLSCADSDELHIGSTIWTAGNASASLESDGQVAMSRGMVSGRYDIPNDAAPVRGRAGRELSRYRGAVFEIDAAVNDGNQGGAVLDNAGNLVGLVSLGCARERRLGTAIPVRAVLADLGLELPLNVPAPSMVEHRALAAAAESLSPAVVLAYLERPNGLGNPEALIRPNLFVDEAPFVDRERLQNWWNAYYHQQQMFWTDQPICAICVDPARGLLITSASNLHGEATRGSVLLSSGRVSCVVRATHAPLDLALLQADRPLPVPRMALSTAHALPLGQALGIIGKHQSDSSYTLTSGVVSATTRRRLRSDYAFSQTDAEGNYGNLGGPVIDEHGAVVGMTVLLGPDDTERPWLINSGVTLFVDAAAITAALPSLEAGQSTERGSFIGLGVSMDFTGKKPRIIAIRKGSGAEKAGLAVGDELESVAGMRIIDHMSIVRSLMKRKAGEQIAVVVRRHGAATTVMAELAEISE